MLLLSSVPFEEFGYRTDLTRIRFRMFTYRVLSRIPDFVPLGGMVLGGVWWITHRREEVAAAEGRREEIQSGAHESGGSNEDSSSLSGRLVFLLIMAGGCMRPIVRFAEGLGPSTNLSDQFPWGIWIGFDVLCGVMLAAGGFTLTAAVHILNIKRLHPIVRPTILTAFLGYLLVCVALMFDLGRPYNIWHPLIMRNPHSVMFEVAYCVMLLHDGAVAGIFAHRAGAFQPAEAAARWCGLR